jgi:hypothetical protein
MKDIDYHDFFSHLTFHFFTPNQTSFHISLAFAVFASTSSIAPSFASSMSFSFMLSHSEHKRGVQKNRGIAENDPVECLYLS